MSQTTAKKLLNVKEVATWLNQSTGWVRDHAKKRRRPHLPAIVIGCSLRFDEAEVQAWLDNLRNMHEKGIRPE